MSSTNTAVQILVRRAEWGAVSCSSRGAIGQLSVLRSLTRYVAVFWLLVLGDLQLSALVNLLTISSLPSHELLCGFIPIVYFFFPDFDSSSLSDL